MHNEIRDLYGFGEYTLDPTDRALYRREEILDLAPKVFDTLLALVESEGRVMTKDELLSRVWADTFVEESNLSQNIYTLRRIFGKRNNFIKTVPRRGYQFVEPVRRIDRNGHPSNKRAEPTESIPRTTPSSGLFQGRSRLVALAGILSVAVVALAAVIWQTRGERSEVPVRDIVFERLTSSGDAFAHAISPDGKLVAYTRSASGDQRLFLKDIDSGNDVELQISNGLKPEFIQFAPDGSKLYFRPKGRIGGPQKVYEVSYFGGEATAVVDDVWGLFSLSPDGRSMAFYRNIPDRNEQQIIVRDLKAGSERPIAKRTVPDQFLNIIYPAWTADGRTLAYVPIGEQANRTIITFVDLETGKERSLEPGLTYIRQIAFLPDNRNMLLVAREKTFQVFRYDYISGEVQRVTNDPNNYRHLSISSQGRRMITQQRKLSSDIWFYPDADASRGRALTEGGSFGLYDLAFTTTGSVVYDSKGKVNRDLRIVDPATGATGVLSRDENTNNNHSPESDRDGNIYFVSDESGSLNIWRVRPDGSQREQVTSGGEGISVAPVLSPDGTWLYFIRKNKADSSIWRMPVAGGEPEKVFSATDLPLGRFASVSPDGKWLAFIYERARGNEDSQDDNEPLAANFGFLNLDDLTVAEPAEIRAGRRIIRWTDGGASFDHNLNDETEATIRRSKFGEANAPSKVVFSLPDVRIMHFAWSSNGKDLAITKGTNESDIVMLELAN